tara:strand:- start:1497 stop:1796 length:300 start_codon:yes stop_codon:yes gene_type:complete
MTFEEIGDRDENEFFVKVALKREVTHILSFRRIKAIKTDLTFGMRKTNPKKSVINPGIIRSTPEKNANILLNMMFSGNSLFSIVCLASITARKPCFLMR